MEGSKAIKSHQRDGGIVSWRFKTDSIEITIGTPADLINTCLKASTLWGVVKEVSLATNMRVQLYKGIQF